ncbi:hypothetical protein C447_00230 [Halococcus hamelinensis 100A6]|uniref:ArsR family transcriptional regulator n=1 Tax=Halococcus hamelinensis 100A6 TaxID=1132509 RepID=M0MC59_9EURY|nr:hypothetical protein C447_00230 [Halococcus hamelinensis 100A6]
MRILQALLDILRTEKEYPASFSALQAEAGADVSSQFSYHLDELTGHFLKHTNEGYAFRYAGWKVATAILAGIYNQRDEFAATSIAGTCPRCETDALEATYQDEWMEIDCRACETRLTRYPFPPGGLAGRSPSEFLHTFDQHVRTHMRLAREGVCPACFGPMKPFVERNDSDTTASRDAGYKCTRCGNRLYPSIGMLLLNEKPVREFLRNRELPVDVAPFWEIGFCVDDRCTVVTCKDPWRCEVQVAADSDTLILELNEHLKVISTSILDNSAI